MTSIEPQTLIEARLRETGRSVKTVDLIGALIVLVAGVLGFLLLAVIVDQWLVPGGLGSWARAMVLAVLVIGAIGYVFKVVWPLLVGRINPAYAAYTIEQSVPTLKNSLLNFVLFGRQRQAVPTVVYEQMGRQAAAGVAAVGTEVPVDRSKVIRTGYLLLAVTVACCLYQVFSPKSPWQSVGRLLAPWADILPASRVAIRDIQPGAAQVVRGQAVEVSAIIEGLADDENATLVYSSTDGQLVDRRVPLVRPAEAYRYQARLPDDERGVQQAIVYHIEAGDACSRRFQVGVVATPTIWVEKLRLRYPDYTQFSARQIFRQGAIQALEGTQVTVTARANHLIKSASIDFDCDGVGDLVMRVEGTQATASFPLTLKDDRRTPTHASYCLRFTNLDDRQNADPVHYPIQVTPDLPPEIELLAPQERVVQVPWGGKVQIEVEAKDPDFALSTVRLWGTVEGETKLEVPLLAEPHVGQFVAKHELRPREAGFKPGDRIEYWATCRDNKTPVPGVAETNRQWIVVTGAEDDQANEQPSDGQQQPSDVQQADEQNPSSDTGDESSGEAQGEQQGSGEQSGESGQPSDGQQGQDQASDGQGSGSQQGSQDQASDGQGQGNAEGQSAADDASPTAESGDESGAGGVARDGSQDGDAFEAIREHLNESEESSDQAGEAQPSDQGQSEASPGANDPSPSGENAPGKQQPQAETGAGASDGNSQGNDQSSGEGQSPNDGTAGNDSASDGDQSSEGQASGNQTESPPEGQSPGAAPGKQQQPGSSDAGQQGEEQQGTPRPQSDAQPNPQKKPGDGAQRPSGESPQSPAHGNRESDSQGDQGGDKQGGGEQGGGQTSQQPGTGTPGQNTESTQGDGSSDQAGQGETSERPGDDTAADRSTGQSSQQTSGQGARSDQQGDQADNQASGKQPSTTDSQGQPSPDGPSGKQAEQSDGGRRSPQASGGDGESSGTTPKSPDQTNPRADDANLEYTQKATDLVLRRLQDQLDRRQVDPKLLDKLGWSADDLKRFVERWQRLKQAAQGPAAEAQQARDDLRRALRSLGLRPDQVRRVGPTKTDRLGNLREGQQVPVPPDYEEQLRAYRKALSRVRDEEPSK